MSYQCVNFMSGKLFSYILVIHNKPPPTVSVFLRIITGQLYVKNQMMAENSVRAISSFGDYNSSSVG